MANAHSTPAFTVNPLILVVPGNDDEASRAWAARWESSLPHAARLELGNWARPHRNTWVNRLNLAILRAERSVVVVADGLACLAVAWWAEYEAPGPDGPLRAALLVDPPDVDRSGSDPRLAAFPSCPRSAMPFATCLLASRSRPAFEQRSLRQLARDWEATFDTIAPDAVVPVPARSAVSSLGQRFLAGALSSVR